MLLASILGGCVAVWGGAYKIEAANADSVIMKYDGHFISRRKVMTIARNKCAGFDRRAKLQSVSTSIWGLTTIVVDCAPSQAKPPPTAEATHDL